MVGESQEPVGAGVGGAAAGGSNKTPTLSEYGTNLTTQAAEVREITSVYAQHVLVWYAWLRPALQVVDVMSSGR